MPSIVISCAGDNELARKINYYLMDKITPSHDTVYISLSEDELEIVLEKLGVSKDEIRKLLHDFIKSNSELADYYSITEFNDNVFVVGIPKSLDEMTVNCEICGYIASSEDDLNIHKRTHGLIFIL
ncbi:MAG: zinc finger protein [Nitrososphaera sp.]|nr:zinc finger protein [Nitrososphaera sp.]